jgi:hypothetical protein
MKISDHLLYAGICGAAGILIALMQFRPAWFPRGTNVLVVGSVLAVMGGIVAFHPDLLDRFRNNRWMSGPADSIGESGRVLGGVVFVIGTLITIGGVLFVGSHIGR